MTKDDRAAVAARRDRGELIANERRGDQHGEDGGRRKAARDCNALHGPYTGEQERRDDQNCGRERHPADKGRAFKAGNDEQDQRREPGRARPLRVVDDEHHRRDHA